jgi:hypothetical protein
MADKYFDSKNPMEWDIVEFHRFFIEKNRDRPEKLDYKTAADKLARCLRDIVSRSASADTIRQALNLQEKAKVSVDFSCTYVMLQLDRSSLRPWPYIWLSTTTREFC